MPVNVWKCAYQMLLPEQSVSTRHLSFCPWLSSQLSQIIVTSAPHTMSAAMFKSQHLTTSALGHHDNCKCIFFILFKQLWVFFTVQKISRSPQQLTESVFSQFTSCYPMVPVTYSDEFMASDFVRRPHSFLFLSSTWGNLGICSANRVNIWMCPCHLVHRDRELWNLDCPEKTNKMQVIYKTIRVTNIRIKYFILFS